MKQIVKFEVFLSNEKTFVKTHPTHVFERCFSCEDNCKLKEMDDAKFDFEWSIRSFVLSCRDVFTQVYVNKSVVTIDYDF